MKQVMGVIASYSIPLGGLEVDIVFKGEGSLAPEHFDALLAYVELFKKQKTGGSSPAPAKEPGEDWPPDSGGTVTGKS